MGYVVALLVEAMHYKPQGRGFEPDCVTGISPLHNPSDRTMALGSTQPLKEMSTIDIWGPRYSVVKVLCYKSEGRWFDPSWCQWIFH